MKLIIIVFFYLIILSNVFAITNHSQSIKVKAFDGLILNGVIDFPEKKENIDHPAIIFIHGSGPADRNHWLPAYMSSNNQEIRIFRDLSETLTSAGFIVIRYDKRGYGKHGVDLQNIQIDPVTNEPIFDDPYLYTSTHENLVKDVESFIQHILEQKFINKDKIYLLGISEGTTIIPKIITNKKNPAIKGLILLSTTARTLPQSIYYQSVTNTYNKASKFLDIDGNNIIDEEEINLLDPREFPYKLESFDMNKDGVSSLLELKAYLLDEYNTYWSTLKGKTIKTNPLKNYYLNREKAVPEYNLLKKYKGSVLQISGKIDAQTPYEEAIIVRELLKKNTNVNLIFKAYSELGHGLSPNIGPHKLINTFGPIQNIVKEDIFQWAKDQIKFNK